MKESKLLTGSHHVRDFIESLPKPWRDEIFEENIKSKRGHMLDKSVPSYSEAINYALCWSDCRRRASFWADVCVKLGEDPGYLHTLPHESSEEKTEKDCASGLLSGPHTVREYIESLPKSWRDEIFQENSSCERRIFLNDTVDSYAYAVDKAMHWDSTKRGFGFWENVRDKLRRYPGYLHTLDHEKDEIGKAKKPKKTRASGSLDSWLEDFPEPFKSQITQYLESSRSSKTLEDLTGYAADSFADAFSEMVDDFVETVEGYDYWREIYSNLRSSDDYLAKLTLDQAKQLYDLNEDPEKEDFEVMFKSLLSASKAAKKTKKAKKVEDTEEVEETEKAEKKTTPRFEKPSTSGNAEKLIEIKLDSELEKCSVSSSLIGSVCIIEI